MSSNRVMEKHLQDGYSRLVDAAKDKTASEVLDNPASVMKADCIL